MGEVIQIELVEDDKWYCVTVDAHEGGFPLLFGCDMPYLGSVTACREGLGLKRWANNRQCEEFQELIFWNGRTAQRIRRIEGPYPTGACNNECAVG